MYRVCTACRIPPVCRPELCSQTRRTLTQVRIGGSWIRTYADTCATADASRASYRATRREVLQTPKLYFFPLSSLRPLAWQTLVTLCLSLSLLLPLPSTLLSYTLFASPSSTFSPPLAWQRFLFLPPAHILHSDLALFFPSPFHPQVRCLFQPSQTATLYETIFQPPPFTLVYFSPLLVVFCPCH